MFPIHIQIDISPQLADSDIEDMMQRCDIIYQSELKPRGYRKKPHQSIQEYLNQKVPGRRKQIEQISKYVHNLKIGEKSPLCLHGSTGCGKTSIVTELINFLKQNNPQFHVLYINCLTFTSVKRIYSVILQELFDIRQRKPEQVLSRIFTESQQQQTSQLIRLIIFDQIDQCFNHKSFIYNILQWVQVSTFAFGIILISNMVDFSANIERKSKSRIKFSSVIFSPYHFQELIQIVKFKYADTNHLFQEDSIIFLCKKIANINSDVRLLEKYYADALHNRPKTSIQKISITDVQSLFTSQFKGARNAIRPYEFILQILWRSPKGKNIAVDIEHYCLANAFNQYKQNQVLEFLSQLQEMKVLKLNRSLRASDFYYNSWGIQLQQFAYTLEATRHNL